jgi:glycosyltransferase involved in cell wall biosynthesis
MKILHLTPYYAPAWAFGGVVSAVQGLAEAQSQAGHQVSVYTSNAGASQLPADDRLNGVTIRRFANFSPFLRARLGFSTPRGLRLALANAEADIIHSHEWRTSENLLLSRAKPKRASVPLVLSGHGTLGYEAGRVWLKKGWDFLLGRGIAGTISAFAALSQTEAETAQALWGQLGLAPPPHRIIGNGVASDFAAQVEAARATAADFRAQWRLGTGPVILFLGRLHPRKGLHVLLPAFAQAKAARPDLYPQLLIAGPDEGAMAAAKAQAQALGLGEAVIFTGLLGGPARLAALASADLLVLPAIGEGFPMAVLEAMAAQLPVIVTPGCNLPDVVTEGAGLLSERAIAPLASALLELLANPAQSQMMGLRGAAWVARSFTWPQVAQQMISFYEELR